MRFGYLSAFLLFAGVPAAAQDSQSSFAIGGVDVSESGFYTYLGGGTRLGGDMDTSGPLVRVQVGYGEFDQVLPTGNVDGSVTAGNLMLGYQWVGMRTRVTGYAGVDFQDHDLPATPLSPVAGSNWGAKAQLEVYSQPSDDVMLLGIGSYSTANDSYFVLGKAGVRVGGNLFLGPEAGTLGNERFDQWRVGGHLTGFQLGPVGVGASVGYVENDPGDNGIYGTVGFTARF